MAPMTSPPAPRSTPRSVSVLCLVATARSYDSEDGQVGVFFFDLIPTVRFSNPGDQHSYFDCFQGLK